MQVRILERPLDREEEFGDRERFLNEVVGAESCRFHCGFDRAVTGHHDDRSAERTAFGPLLQQRDSISIRHPDIEEDQIRAPDPTRVAGLGRILGDGHLESFVLQDLLEEDADIRLVVDHQDLLITHDAFLSISAFAPGVMVCSGS